MPGFLRLGAIISSDVLGLLLSRPCVCCAHIAPVRGLVFPVPVCRGIDIYPATAACEACAALRHSSGRESLQLCGMFLCSIYPI